MLRRWIIRGFFIGLMTVCMADWVASYNVGWCINYGSGNASWELACYRGRIRAKCYDGDPGTGGSYGFTPVQGWSAHLGPVQTIEEPRGELHPVIHGQLLGFSLGNFISIAYIIMPLWFPTIISTALLWLVWQKTRPKPDSKTSFPVEPFKPPITATSKTEIAACVCSRGAEHLHVAGDGIGMGEMLCRCWFDPG